MKKVSIHPAATLSGTVSIPGDKSISHRALMFASLAEGQSIIDNLLEGHDCMATLQVMRALGVHIALKDGSWIVNGRGKAGLVEPSSILDCKNSGTTMRLLAGLLSAMPFMSILDGTEQIKTRPMDRVIMPLSKMGAKIYGREADRLAPLAILPADLRGHSFTLAIKSAQVKSALILAGLFAKGPTRILNAQVSRDHSERLLSFMGASIVKDGDALEISPLEHELVPITMKIPADISSAAFLVVAAVFLAPQGVTLKDVGVNETRTGILDALTMMGAHIELLRPRMVGKEPIADIFIKKSSLQGQSFAGDHIVRMIDEIPILALAATQASGRTIIRDALELRVKESDRISRTVELLKGLGANIFETEDGMVIDGPTKLLGRPMLSFGDHRMALMLSIAGLLCESPLEISGSEVTDDSFPGFFATLTQLGADVEHLS